MEVQFQDNAWSKREEVHSFPGRISGITCYSLPLCKHYFAQLPLRDVGVGTNGVLAECAAPSRARLYPGK